MATYHCTVKSGGKGKGAAHADYIAREGRYAAIKNDRDKYEKYEDLVCKGSGNMPEWARENPSDFWKAADEFERAGGRTYTEIEIALPTELTEDQQKELVEDLIKEQLGENHAYSYAIHNKPATLDPSKKQPHAHIMFSERKLDGIERDREQYFKRGNAKHPERGGHMKDPDWNRRGKVEEVRRDWADLQNKHLERAGHEVRVDHRNLEDQKIAAIERGDLEKARELNREPERHLGPKVAQKTVREVREEMSKAQSKDEKIEARQQFYDKKTTNEKSRQAAAARRYKKEVAELQREKRAAEIEKIQQRLPIKNLTQDQAEKFALAAYWRKAELALAKDKGKLDRDKGNHDRVKAAVEIRLHKAREKDLRKTKHQTELIKATKESERVAKWGVELKRTEEVLERRAGEIRIKRLPPGCEVEIKKSAEQMIKQDVGRVERLCEMAEKDRPGQYLTVAELKYMVELSTQIRQRERDALGETKKAIEAKLITPEQAEKRAIEIYTRGATKKLAAEKEAILVELKRPGKTPEEAAAFRQRVEDHGDKTKAVDERINSPEGKTKIKEFAERIEKKRNAPVREELNKINEQIKPLDRELFDLKGLSQKLKQAAQEQKFQLTLTPRNIARRAGRINELLTDRQAARQPRGRTQARIGEDDDPSKKRGIGLDI